MPYDFLFTFLSFSKQTAGLGKKSDSLEWPPYKDEHVEGPNISVPWTVHILDSSSISANRNFADLLFWEVKEFKDYSMKTVGNVKAWIIKIV